MAMPGPPRLPAPSNTRSIAPLPQASSPANSAVATLQRRSPAQCCAPSTPPVRPRTGSAHLLVGYFPPARISGARQLTHRIGGSERPAFCEVGKIPIALPIYGVGRFMVDAGRDPWFATETAPAHGSRQSYRRGARWFGGERPRLGAMNAQELLQEIADYCRHSGLAESTFGRRAVNDGKLAQRLRNGGRITTETLDRIREFMENNQTVAPRAAVIERGREPRPAPVPAAPAPAQPGPRDP